MSLENSNYLLSMAGIVVFAVTAVLAVAPKGIDLFGASVLGMITAIGGGTVRDLILDVPVFWALDLNYLWVALVSSILAFFTIPFLSRRKNYQLLLHLDGFGAALFAVHGTRKAWELDFGSPLAPILLGILTAIGGGLIRDVLAGRRTLLMVRELYATPVTFGCCLFMGILQSLPELQFGGGIFCIATIVCLRSAAIHWKLRVPACLTSKAAPEC